MMTPEERMRGLTPEERLRGLSKEDMKQLRQLIFSTLETEN